MVYFYDMSAQLLNSCIFKYAVNSIVTCCLQTAAYIIQQVHPASVYKMLEQSQSGNRVLAATLFLATTVFITIVYLLRERYKKDKLLAEYRTEKRISRKLHDEIANEIYSTMLFIDSADVIAGTKKELVLQQLDAIYKATRDISRENNEIDTGPHFPIQLKLMLKLYSDTNVNVLIIGVDRVNWGETDSINKIATFRILQELMVNMKKHSSASVVVLTFEQQNNLIKITYSDNGKGITGNSFEGRNAFKNIKARVEDIGGVLETDVNGNDKGTHLYYTFTI